MKIRVVFPVIVCDWLSLLLIGQEEIRLGNSIPSACSRLVCLYR